MKSPANIQTLSVTDSKGFVTNVDTVDLGDNFCLRTRGVRTTTAGFLIQRDFGTKHRYDSYPVTKKDMYCFISGVTKAEGEPIVVKSTAHGKITGDSVVIFGVVGATQANGTFTITKIDDDSFELDGTSAATLTTYVSGGTFLRTDSFSPILAAHTFVDRSTGMEHDIVIVREENA